MSVTCPACLKNCQHSSFTQAMFDEDEEQSYFEFHCQDYGPFAIKQTAQSLITSDKSNQLSERLVRHLKLVNPEALSIEDLGVMPEFFDDDFQ